MLKRTPNIISRVAIAGLAAALAFMPAVSSAQRANTQNADAEELTPTAINNWTLGLAAGRIEGAPVRLAAELARALDNGNEMRVMPIVTRGPFDNVYDLLHLKGIDLAVVSGDILDHVKNEPSLARYRSKIVYVTQLVPSEVHIVVRPGINSLKDLEGKAVNFNTKGTQAAYTGARLFDALGLKIDKRFIPHPQAMSRFKKGDTFAAIVWVTSKPLGRLVRAKFPAGYKLLPVPADAKLLDYYLPSRLDATDYPGLIPAGGSIETVAVPTVLAAFNFTRNPDRQRRMNRFVDYLFERIPDLQSKPGFDPKWKSINLAATIPGWQRLPAMQARLDKEKSARRAALQPTSSR